MVKCYVTFTQESCNWFDFWNDSIDIVYSASAHEKETRMPARHTLAKVH